MTTADFVGLLLIAFVVVVIALIIVVHRDARRREIEQYQTMFTSLAMHVTGLRHKVEDLQARVDHEFPPGHGKAPTGSSILDGERDAAPHGPPGPSKR